MKRSIRMNTFETNSSSTHALILIDKSDFESFKHGDTYFDIERGDFITKESIVNLNDFKHEHPDFEHYSEEKLNDALNDFIEDYCDCDYPLLATYKCLDLCTQEVFDEQGNEKIAFSYYING